MRRFLPAILIFITLFSCKQEFDSQNSYNLNGRWDIIKATRNGKETKTLKSGFFEFDSTNSSIKSNIFQIQEDKNYQLVEDVITVKGQERMTFKILDYSNDTLELSSKIWKHDLQFLLIRNDSLLIDSTAF